VKVAWISTYSGARMDARFRVRVIMQASGGGIGKSDCNACDLLPTQNDLVRVVNHAEVRQIVPFALNSKLANWVVVRNQQ